MRKETLIIFICGLIIISLSNLSGQTILNGTLKIDSVLLNAKTHEILITDTSNFIFKRSTLDLLIPSSVLVLSRNEQDTNLIENNYSNQFNLSPQILTKGNATTKYGEWTRFDNLQNEPISRIHHTAIWTGSKMIVFGGYNENGMLGGESFNNISNTWSSLSPSNAPTNRYAHTAVWTGSKMIIWGGSTQTYVVSSSVLNTGAIYDPATNVWTTISTTNAPSARANHTAVWTGTEMIIWGGQSGVEAPLKTGAKYNPATNTWTTITLTNSPSERFFASAVWTGTDMIVWGGQSGYYQVNNNGSKYNPVTDTWSVIQMNNNLESRYSHSAVWTGSKMIILGGRRQSGKTLLGAMYDPVNNSWSNMSMENSPLGIERIRSYWTGADLIVVGEFITSHAQNYPIKKYNFATNKWLDCNEKNIHKGTLNGNGVWTGTELILWGGFDSNYNDVSGISKYDPTKEGYGYTKSEKLYGYKKVSN